MDLNKNIVLKSNSITFVISIDHDMISKIFTGKSHLFDTQSRPADTIQDLFIKYDDIIQERHFYSKSCDFFRESSNG